MTFTEAELFWLHKLQSESVDQKHLIPNNASPDQIKNIIKQIEELHQVCPGGLLDYIQRAKKLLQDSKADLQPYEGYVAEVPEGEKFENLDSAEFQEREAIGADELEYTCFCIVAGGLGERLGFQGIKLSIHVESTTGMTYLELYARNIQAIQNAHFQKTNKLRLLPLVIMTSADTHNLTVDLLKSKNNFGLSAEQITILQQAKVPAFKNVDAHIAFAETESLTIDSKPHGHGDVHVILSKSCLIQQWLDDGFRWLVFLQDTNGLAFRSLPSLLGVSKANNFIMNTVVTPRKSGEAMGVVCALKHQLDGSTLTINVEYNQLDALLRQNHNVRECDEQGYSPFPGNTNILAFQLKRYNEVLMETEGRVPEFVNPKYADSSKTTFKSSSRLECMMQEFPKLLSSHDKVGVTRLPRWLCFSAVKNNINEAAAKARAHLPPECAFSGESDYYHSCCEMLRLAAVSIGYGDVQIADQVDAQFAGVRYRLGPRILLLPRFGITFQQIKKRLIRGKGKSLVVKQNSTLVVDGDIEIGDLMLEGTLIADMAADKSTVLDGTRIVNRGWVMREVEDRDGLTAGADAVIRGYTVEKIETEIVN